MTVDSGSESRFVKDNLSPLAVRDERESKTDSNQNKGEEEEQHETEYKKWWNANGLENEGVKPFEFDTRSIAGGVQQYYGLFQSYPNGGNREIAMALFGDNPRKLKILNWPARRLSAVGEFLDLWGTPYRIRVTPEKIEIRSAGPNRQFWDADDQVAE